MNNVEIKKGTPQTVIVAGGDNISGFIGNAIAVATTFALGAVYTVYSVKDAEALGITADYDSTNAIRLHHHISEFYRMAGAGTKLYIMGVAQSVAMVDMVDATEEYAQKLLREAYGEIRQLAVSLQPASSYVATVEQGIDADVLHAIAKAQGLAEKAYTDGRPCQIILEGRGYQGNAASVVDLGAIVIDTASVEAPKVSVVIGQDWKYADTQDAVGKKYASVGLVLGCISRIPVNYNIGEVGTMDLTNTGLGAYTEAGLSDHTKTLAKESDWTTLNAKRFIFPYREKGTPGINWNNDYTAVSEQIDLQTNVMNENTISYGRVMDKAVRLLTAAYAPRIKKVVLVDALTGKLKLGVIKDLEGIGSASLEAMNTEISGYKVTVDPNSDLLTGDRELIVNFDIVPTGTIGKISGTINLKMKL